MSVEVGFHFTGRVTEGGRNEFFGLGPTEELVQTLASATGKRANIITQTVAAAATVDVWLYAESTNIGGIALWIVSPTTGGSLDFTIQGDRPVSASDLSASGLALTENAFPRLVYGWPLIIPSHTILTNVTKATHAAGPIGAVGEEVGRVYRLRANNPSSVSVDFARALIN